MESVMQLHDIKYGSGPGSGGPQAPHVEVDAFRNGEYALHMVRAVCGVDYGPYIPCVFGTAQL